MAALLQHLAHLLDARPVDEFAALVYLYQTQLEEQLAQPGHRAVDLAIITYFGPSIERLVDDEGEGDVPFRKEALYFDDA